MVKFWLVYNLDKQSIAHPATQVYTSKHGAIEGAERNLSGEPGGRFVVLEAVAMCKRSEVVWEAIK